MLAAVDHTPLLGQGALPTRTIQADRHRVGRPAGVLGLVDLPEKLLLAVHAGEGISVDVVVGADLDDV